MSEPSNDNRFDVVEVTEVRLSPDHKRLARSVPSEFVHEGKRWISVDFSDCGATISLLTDSETLEWKTIWRADPTTED